MSFLQLFRPSDLKDILDTRPGETRLGETIELPGEGALKVVLQQSDARFVILGLPEDIGVRANGGIGGTQTAWPKFLKSFLNIQETEFLSGRAFLLLGAMDFTSRMHASVTADVAGLRELTAQIDESVFPVIQAIVASGKIPVVIGGGHNNAFPVLKGASIALGQKVHAVNLDAHSDFRIMEGRHSGNGFRYAYHEKYLGRYAMLGLHEAYNSAAVIKDLLSNPDLLPLFWDDIFVRERMNWSDALQQALHFVSGAPFGVELDLDALENVLSSAATPVGLHTHHALQYLYRCGVSGNAAYFHLPEGVVLRSDGQENIWTGKLLSYLVQAFAKGILASRA